MGVTPYPTYRPSGVPWLGGVPAHWEVRRLKANVSDVINLTDHRKPGERYIALEHVESWTGKISEPQPDVSFESQVKRFEAGDVLFGKLRPYLAKVAQPDRNGVCVSEFLVLRPRDGNLLSGYLEKLLRSKPVIDAIDATTFGAKMPRADWHTIGNMAQPLPPLDEQAAIVRYLDHADEIINRYISAKEQLIALLEERRQAVIHQAVTRGLNPNAPLKPSGVSWLGDVPAHWDVRRLKTNVSDVVNLTDHRKPSEHYIALEHVESWTGKISEPQPDVRFESQVKRFEAGDVLFGKLRPYLAKVAQPNRNGVCVGEFLVLRPHNGDLLPGYLESLLRSKPVIDAIDATTFGAKMPRADWHTIGNMVQPCPTPDEQAAIVVHLDQATAETNAGIAHARRQIELMREYRTRLIADAVTGQIDVRRAVLDLPD